MPKHKIAFGAIIGAAAGIVAGVLLAPKPGRSIRTDIKAKVKELKQNTTRTIREKKIAKSSKGSR